MAAAGMRKFYFTPKRNDRRLLRPICWRGGVFHIQTREQEPDAGDRAKAERKERHGQQESRKTGKGVSPAY